MGEFCILVASSRPSVQAFFADMGRRSPGSVVIAALPLSSLAIADAADVLEAATVAVVDAAVDPAEALELCGEMRAQRPSLPITALFCCPHSATAGNLRAFAAVRVGSFLDLQLSAEETLRVLRGVARGQGVVRLQLTEESSTALFDAHAGENGASRLSEHDIGLLRAVALGLTDHEIGSQLHLSPHTVKRRIERLRRAAHARNRIQLAAWASRHDAIHDERDGAPRNGARRLGPLM